MAATISNDPSLIFCLGKSQTGPVDPEIALSDKEKPQRYYVQVTSRTCSNDY